MDPARFEAWYLFGERRNRRGMRMADCNGVAVARGIARGIDVHGALVVETPQGVRRFISGDVTVRA